MATPWFDLACEAVEALLDETRKPRDEVNIAKLEALYDATATGIAGLSQNLEDEIATMEDCAKIANSPLLQIGLMEIRRTAERRLGQLLAESEKNKGER